MTSARLRSRPAGRYQDNLIENRITPTKISQWLNTLSVCITVAIFSIVTIGLWQARQDAWREAQLASENLITALGRDIGSNVRLVEHNVGATVDALEVPSVWAYPSIARQRILFATRGTAPYGSRTFILDAQGRLMGDSLNRGTPGTSFVDREYFQIHRAKAHAGTFLSEPMVSRTKGERRIVVLSRRITASDGRFSGIVAATIPLDPVRGAVSAVVAGPKSSINLLTLRGTFLARNAQSGPSATSIGGTPVFERMLREGNGRFVGVSALDNVERLYTFKRLEGLPLILDVAIATEEIVAGWRKRALLFGLAVTALCAAVLALTYLFQRELIKRGIVEAELSALAATDGLTGLGNRRTFDSALGREWRRAKRTEIPLSLIMIDADHFKAFNDLYGHVAGDKVLQRIAATMRDIGRRADDQSARIGGEEFAILMPGIGAADAAERAKYLCDAIFRLHIPHAGSPSGVVTVSIGVTMR